MPGPSLTYEAIKRFLKYIRRINDPALVSTGTLARQARRRRRLLQEMEDATPKSFQGGAISMNERAKVGQEYLTSLSRPREIFGELNVKSQRIAGKSDVPVVKSTDALKKERSYIAAMIDELRYRGKKGTVGAWQQSQIKASYLQPPRKITEVKEIEKATEKFESARRYKPTTAEGRKAADKAADDRIYEAAQRAETKREARRVKALKEKRLSMKEFYKSKGWPWPPPKKKVFNKSKQVEQTPFRGFTGESGRQMRVWAKARADYIKKTGKKPADDTYTGR